MQPVRTPEDRMKRLLKIPEFLELYSISRTAFYREVTAGRLPLIKIGKASRIAVEDAEAWASALPKMDRAA
jgi:predicted DNA-binding transcriptional regulator AlpA